MATGGKWMGRTRVSSATVWLGGLAAAALGAGCDGRSPPEQSGTQRLAGRDFDNLFFWNEQTAAFTRQTTTSGSTSQDLWVWPDGENAPLLALSQIDWSPPSSSREIVVGDILMTGAGAERVYDLRARAALDLELVAAPGQPPLAGLDWTSVRRDGGSIVAHRPTGVLFAGRGSSFAFLPPPYISWGADFMGNDLAVLASPSSAEIDPAHVYRMTLPSADLSPLPLPPLPLATPKCSAFSIPPCRTFRVLGCGADDAVCPETGRAPCAILYLRLDTKTGVSQPYAFDVDTGQETALPGSDPTDFVLSPDRHSVAWLHSDVDDAKAGIVPSDQTPIYVHNFCSGAAAECSFPRPQQLAWRDVGDEFVVALAGDQAGLVDVPTGTCSLFGFGRIGQRAFSPGGDRLVWIVVDSVSDLPGQLVIGDATGVPLRLLADDVDGFRFSPDGQSVFIFRSTGFQLSLSWVSLAPDAGPEQLIADAYRGTTLRGNQRVLVIDHWNTQDGSGNLELVDLPSGTRQVLARAVTDLACSGSADGAARVLYSVRGRFASGQDGLWETTLPAP